MESTQTPETVTTGNQGAMSPRTFQFEPWMRIMDNPLLIAMAKLRLRKKERTSLAWVTGLVGVSCALIGLASDTSTEWIFMFTGFLGFASLNLLYRGVNVLAGLMVQERTSGILEFHRATPTTSYTDALGYLLGGAAREYYLFALMIPFMFLYALAGSISILDVLAAILLIVVNGVLLHCTALLVGLTGFSKRVTNATAVGTLFIFGAAVPLYRIGLVTPAFLTPVPAFARLFANSDDLAVVAGNVLFFGLPLHPVIFTLLVQASLIAFLFMGVARRLQHERAPVFSRVSALLLFGVVTILTIGGSWEVITNPLSTEGGLLTPRNRIASLTAAYLAGAGLLSTVLLVTLVPHYLDFSRALRRARRLGMAFPGWLEDGATAMPLVPVFFLLSCGGFAILVLAGSGFLDMDRVLSLYTLVALSGTAVGIAFFTAVVEYVRLSVRGSQRSYLLILFLTCVFPFILSGVLGSAGMQEGIEFVLALSPLLGVGGGALAMVAHWLSENGEVSLQSVLLSQVIGAAATAWLTWQSRILLLKLAASIPLGNSRVPQDAPAQSSSV